MIENMCMRRASGEYNRCAELRQECYISIWKHQNSLHPDATPMQEHLWVYWQCRSVFSRRRFLAKAHLLQPIDDNMADSIADSFDESLRDTIESLAAVLNSHERRALNLMADGYNPDEMSKVLDIKYQSAVTLRYRIITKLRKHFK